MYIFFPFLTLFVPVLYSSLYVQFLGGNSCCCVFIIIVRFSFQQSHLHGTVLTLPLKKLASGSVWIRLKKLRCRFRVMTDSEIHILVQFSSKSTFPNMYVLQKLLFRVCIQFRNSFSGFIFDPDTSLCFCIHVRNFVADEVHQLQKLENYFLPPPPTPHPT
jgi:hypothetical protein